MPDIDLNAEKKIIKQKKQTQIQYVGFCMYLGVKRMD